MSVLSLPAQVRQLRRATDHVVRVADQLVDLLRVEGIEAVFGLPGGPISPLNDALIDAPRIRNVTVKHENGAMFAAAGHARVTGRPGVVLVTSGPGILNGMCGLASAYCDGVPMLVLVGEVSRSRQGRGALQDGSAHHLDILSTVRSVTVFAAEVTDPRAAVTMVAHGLRTAAERRGPVVLTVPMDVLVARAAPPEITLGPARVSASRLRTLSRSVKLALERSATGVIMAGAGVRDGDGAEGLVKLAELLQWPVITTPKGKGVFPEDHPLSLGVVGAGGHPSAYAYLQSNDVETVLALGTSLGDLATDGWSSILAPERSFIHVDINPAGVSRNYQVSQFVEASVGEFCHAACEQLANRPMRLVEDFHGPTTYQDPEKSDVGPNGQITPERAIWEIQLSLEQDAHILVDSGEHYLYAVHYLRLTAPDAFIAQSGLGAMGASIGAAIGAKLGAGTRRVAVICGDGGFTMAGSDVATAASLGLPIVFFVFDDQRLGMVENGHGDLYGRTPEFTGAPVDLAGFARSLGAGSARVGLPGELLRLDYSRLTANGRRPGVVVVGIDAGCRMPKNGRTATMAEAPELEDTPV